MTFNNFLGGETNNEEIKKMWKNLETNRDEKIARNLLLNLDEKSNTEAVLLQSRWKVVKQNLREYANYDYHFQVQAKGSPDIAIDLIKDSHVGRALRGNKYIIFLRFNLNALF